MAKKLSITDIARAAGVSRGTVDRALHGRGGISEETRQRISHVCRDLRYRVNMSGRALGLKKAVRLLGVIPENFFFAKLEQGMKTAISEYQEFGFALDLAVAHTTYDNSDGVKQALNYALEQQYDAVIIETINESEVEGILNQLNEAGIHIVTVGTELMTSGWTGHIGSDNVRIGRIGAELVLKLLRRTGTVALTSGFADSTTQKERARGFHEVISRDKGVTVAGRYEYRNNRELAGAITYDIVHGKSADAIFVSNAYGHLIAEAICQMKHQGEVVLVTCDRSLEIDEFIRQGVIDATICQSPFKQGYEAIKLVMELITPCINEQPKARKKVITPIEIVFRENLDQ